jgi:aspartyl-tRNA synthetase
MYVIIIIILEENMNRTHHCGELTPKNLNQSVTLIGWVSKRRNFGSIVFIDLRDREGITQCVFDETLSEDIKDVRNEFILEIKGEVILRKDSNPKLSTGEIEVKVSSFTIVNQAELTPMIIQDDTDALEDTRLKYRYLDLRRPVMQKKLIQRAKIVRTMRNFLDDNGFIDVETPMLTKSTPEGSREYLVPSRVHDGEFYALAQSPQIFKQLLMVAGFERYYQVARCFRDEDLRADRQLDFTQIDIETSFLNEDEFHQIMEDMTKDVMQKVLGLDIKTPFLKLSYKDAMDFYGSDKPDNRFGLKLNELKDVFINSEFQVFKSALEFKDGSIKGIVLENGAHFTRKETDALTEVAKKNGVKGLVVLKYINAQLEGPALKFFSESEVNGLISTLNLKENDLVLITADHWERAANALGTVRLAIRDKLNLTSKTDFSYLWVVDFPMFEFDEDSQKYVAKHHPFTRPKTSDIKYLKENPAEIMAHAYDLVLNGFEIAGGSLRIYDQDMQKAMFEMIGFTEQQINERFGFFVDAFKYGTPPHGGIAFGLDRFAMVLTESDSLRDVIAFPKNASARCPLTNAPSPVDEKQLKELHILIDKN